MGISDGFNPFNVYTQMKIIKGIAYMSTEEVAEICEIEENVLFLRIKEMILKMESDSVFKDVKTITTESFFVRLQGYSYAISKEGFMLCCPLFEVSFRNVLLAMDKFKIAESGINKEHYRDKPTVLQNKTELNKPMERFISFKEMAYNVFKVPIIEMHNILVFLLIVHEGKLNGYTAGYCCILDEDSKGVEHYYEYHNYKFDYRLIQLWHSDIPKQVREYIKGIKNYLSCLGEML
jgi:hypothetical protein